MAAAWIGWASALALGQGPEVARQALVVAGGTVRAIDEVRVPAELPGVLRRVRVRRGDVVAAGQVLAELDDRLATLEVALRRKAAANRAPVEAAEAQAAVAAKELARDLELQSKATVSDAEIDIRRGQHDAAKAKVADEAAKFAQAGDERAKAETLLDQHAVRAPAAGLVLDAPKHEGEAVQLHETVFLLVRLDRVRVEAELDAREARRLNVGAAVEAAPVFGEAPALLLPAPSGVRALAWMADGKLLACGAADGSLWTVEVATGAVRPLGGAGERAVRCLAGIPGEPEVLASGHDDGAVRFWNTRTGQPERPACRADGAGAVAATALAFAPKRVFVGREDGAIAVLDAGTRAVTETLRGHQHRVTALAAAPDGTALLSAADDDAVRRWDLRAGTAVAYAGRRAPPDKAVTRLTLDPLGSFLFNAGPLLQVRRAQDGTVEEHFGQAGRAFAYAALLIPERSLALAGQDDGQVLLWRRAAGAAPACVVRSYAGHGKGAALHDVALSPTGRHFATAGADGAAVWAIPDAATLAAERLPGRIAWISPQHELGGGERIRFHVEVENRGLLLKPHGGARLVLPPAP